MRISGGSSKISAIGSRKVKDVERADIRRLLQNITARGATIQANRTHALVSKIFNWAISEDLATVNPVRGIARPGIEQPRDRILTDDEIRAVWNACEQEPLAYGIAVKLRFLTAQRSGEITRMRWQDIDGDWWTVPAEHAKNGLAHRVPLSRQACAEIDSMGDRCSKVHCGIGRSFRTGNQSLGFESTPALHSSCMICAVPRRVE